jgi:hypothetical protein
MDTRFKYRFKTLTELEKEYGPNFRSIAGFNTEGYMDHLLGNPVEVPNGYVDEDGKISSTFEIVDDNNQRWAVFNTMLTDYIGKPSYKPKKFVYE